MAQMNDWNLTERIKSQTDFKKFVTAKFYCAYELHNQTSGVKLTSLTFLMVAVGSKTGTSTTYYMLRYGLQAFLLLWHGLLPWLLKWAGGAMIRLYRITIDQMLMNDNFNPTEWIKSTTKFYCAYELHNEITAIRVISLTYLLAPVGSKFKGGGSTADFILILCFLDRS